MSNTLIIGAGPIGITLACTLKACNPNSNITVIDKRSDPKRSHGLSISSASIDKIDQILKNALGEPQQVKALQTILKKWKDQFIRTNDIEIDLANQAKKMGINVIRDPAYEIVQGDFRAILRNDPHLTDRQKKLADVINPASTIIAADGAHSVMRSELDISLTDEETLKHMVELKYQTHGSTVPRGYKEASFDASKTGFVGIEAINRHSISEKKPATYLLFVDEQMYNSLREKDSTGKLKGVYGNTWKLEEIKNKAPEIYNVLSNYIDKVKKRGGSFADEQIATLELKIYRNAKSAVNVQGKNILFLGDSNSGLVLQRGFNKGLMEVALCVKAIGEANLNGSSPDVLPQAYVNYEKEVQQLFWNERSFIYLKNKGIGTAQAITSKMASKIQKGQHTSLSFFNLINKIWDTVKSFFLWIGKVFSSFYQWRPITSMMRI